MCNEYYVCASSVSGPEFTVLEVWRREDDARLALAKVRIEAPEEDIWLGGRKYEGYLIERLTPEE